MNHGQIEELLHHLQGVVRSQELVAYELGKLNAHLAAMETRQREKAARKAEKRARKAKQHE